MNDTIERTLYIILLLVFIGVGIAVYVAISFGAKLDQQLGDAAEQRTTQQKTINQLNASVDALKQDNAQQTEYIKCLLTAHNLGQYSTANCVAPNASGKTSEQLQPDGASQNPPNVVNTPTQSTNTENPKSIIPFKRGCTLNLFGLCI